MVINLHALGFTGRAMAVRQMGAGSPLSAKVSAFFAGAALMLAPAIFTCSSTRDTPRRVEEPTQSVYTNGETTITLNGNRVRVESSERGAYWSMEATVRSVREIGRIRMLTVDLDNAAMDGMANPMRGAMPADALTANNMLDAGAPEEKASFIIVPGMANGPKAMVRDAHELTHALLFEYYDANGGRPAKTAEEAIAYSAQIAFGDAKEGFEDVLAKASARVGDAQTIRMARRLIGELVGGMGGKDPRFASDAELRGAANAFLDKICMYEFGKRFAEVVDTSAYSEL